MNLTKKAEEDTKKQKNRNSDIDSCLDSMKNVKYNLVNIQNILKDNFDFIKSKAVIDEKKIDVMSFKIDEIYEKLNNSVYLKNEVKIDNLKDVTLFFFNKYYSFLNKLHETLKNINSYNVSYGYLIEIFVYNIKSIYAFWETIEIIEIIIKNNLNNNFDISSIKDYKLLSSELEKEIGEFLKEFCNMESNFFNNNLYSSKNLENILEKIFLYIVDSGNIIAKINDDFDFSLLDIGLDENIYNDINMYYKEIENELILLQNLVKNRLMIDEKLEVVYNDVDENDDFVVSVSDLDARIALLKSEINKKINQINDNKQMVVNDSAEFVIGLLKK